MADLSPKVMVVEDERGTADLYSAWLESECDVRTAYDGSSALEQIDAGVDVVFLDRRMPGLSGDEVLEAIRDRGFDCRVAMLTAVEPDFDVIEMAFDDYLTKPVSEAELLETVNRFVEQRSLDDHVRQHLSLIAKQQALTETKDEADLETSEEYRQLVEEIDRSRAQLDESVSGDVLVDFLLEETGSYLYAVVQYDPESWEYKYVSEAGEGLIADLDDHVHEVLDEFRREGRQMGELGEALQTSGHFCSLHLFGGFVLINFSQADGHGILCGFDPNAASHLTDFVEVVLPYVRQAGLSGLDEDPSWITP